MPQLCLYGAGNIGRKFMESKSWKEMKKRYTNFAFYDNNQKLPERIAGVERIKSLDQQRDILITCNHFLEVYYECVVESKNVIGIYDLEDDCIYDYKSLCKKRRTGYDNEEMIVYSENERQIRKKHLQAYLETRDLYHNISEVAIMLSNLCNYAIIHPQCPANCVKEKEIMPGSKVYQILDELGKINYEGSICFHIYNEPTIDPRLFVFIQYAKRKMPNCKIRVYSNGYYLNQTMVEEFHDIGVDVLITTGYGIEDYKRLINLDVRYPFSVEWGHLDERMDWYREENTKQKLTVSQCYTFLNQICIYSNGEVGTCCLDYKTPYKLGNVFETSLKEVLSSRELLAFQDELIKGDRSRFPLCGNCHWHR